MSRARLDNIETMKSIATVVPILLSGILLGMTCNSAQANPQVENIPRRGVILKRNSRQVNSRKPRGRVILPLNEQMNGQGVSRSNVYPARKQLKQNNRRAMLSKIESLFRIIADGVLVVGCAIGGPLMLWGFIELATGAADGVAKVILGLVGVGGGLATPYCIEWLFEYARNASLF